MQSRLSIKKTGPYILWYLIVGAGAVLMLLPFWWMLISACRPEHQIFSRTISLVPAQITFEHFKTAWIRGRFWTVLPKLNTSCLHTDYRFCHLRIHGSLRLCQIEF